MHPRLAFAATLVAMLSLLVLQTAADETVSSCFGKGNRSLDVDCGEGYMVHIKRSFYGFSATGQCQLTREEAVQGACTKDDASTYDCVGRSRCSINLPTGERGLNVPACGQRSNYLQVVYTCVKADTVHDICSEDRLFEQSGYIKTPRYPLNYRKQGECAMTITAHPTQKIRLQIIDMNLKASGRTACADLIYFNDKLRSITLCSHRSNNTYEWLSNTLHIELQSTSGGQSKGFWLYYEAYPPLTNTIPAPNPKGNNKNDGQQSSSSSSNDANNNNNGVQGEGDKGGNGYSQETTTGYNDPHTTVPLIRNQRPRSSKLPFAAIAGGVIGTLSLILVILLLMLLVKWLNERKYYRAEKILEIKNPAFRSSGDFYDQSQPNNNASDYNYC